LFSYSSTVAHLSSRNSRSEYPGPSPAPRTPRSIHPRSLNPDSLRGPQFDAAWCDELCKWRRPDDAWDTLQFALRLGAFPQVVVTTTPRPIPLLKRIMEDHATAISRSRTADNANNLAPAFPSWDIVLSVERTNKDSTALRGLESDTQHFEKLETSGS
jgi:Terminase large subunit, T4likevirus-type, N-terminal